jgi:hypothetical protein
MYDTYIEDSGNDNGINIHYVSVTYFDNEDTSMLCLNINSEGY